MSWVYRHPEKKRHISFLHVHAQSARNKADEITIPLESFEFLFNVIMVTRTWYHHESEVLRSASSATYFLNMDDKVGRDGDMLLIKELFECEIVKHFSKTITTITRCWRWNVVHHFFLCVIYRPPQCNVFTFLKFLDTLLSWVNENY